MILAHDKQLNELEIILNVKFSVLPPWLNEHLKRQVVLAILV